MFVTQIIFYIFAFVLLASAIFVVISRNPVHSALFLVLAFFSSAAIWLFLQAEFLALVLILVYVGAVMTLFLFVVMMLNINIEPKQKKYVTYFPLGLLVIALLGASMIYMLSPQHLGPISQAVPVVQAADYSNVHQLGMVLYTTDIYPFELAAVILLVAIIATISLSLRQPRAKTQSIPEQLQTRKEDRVKLVDIKSEEEKKGKH